MESVTPISRCAIRAETVHLWTKFGSFGLTLNEEQIPQIVKNNKNQGGRETSWKDFFCAQGRCATRLRYAPTYIALLILNYFHGVVGSNSLAEGFVLLRFGSKLCPNCVRSH
jgi:hypothetical protein